MRGFTRRVFSVASRWRAGRADIATFGVGKARAVKALTSPPVDRHRTAYHMQPRPCGHLAACANLRPRRAGHALLHAFLKRRPYIMRP